MFEFSYIHQGRKASSSVGFLAASTAKARSASLREIYAGSILMTAFFPSSVTAYALTAAVKRCSYSSIVCFSPRVGIVIERGVAMGILDYLLVMLSERESLFGKNASRLCINELEPRLKPIGPNISIHE